METTISDPPPPGSEDTLAANGPRLFTWISESGRLVEQVRVVRTGGRLRATGHLIAGEDPDLAAFSLSYEAEIDGDGGLRRIGLTALTVDAARSVELARDADGAWLLDERGARSRVGEPGVVDVDVTFSVFFASVILRRHGLHAQPGDVDERVLSVDSTTLRVSEDSVTFTSDDERVHGITATASTSANVDADGIILDVPGLTRRA